MVHFPNPNPDVGRQVLVAVLGLGDAGHISRSFKDVEELLISMANLHHGREKEDAGGQEGKDVDALDDREDVGRVLSLILCRARIIVERWEKGSL